MGQGQDRGGLLATLAEIREQQDPTDPTGEAAELPECCLAPEGSGDPITQQKDHPTCHDLQERGQCHPPSAIEVNLAVQFQTAGFGAGWAALLVAGSLHPTSTHWFGSLAGFAASCHVIQARLLHLQGERRGGHAEPLVLALQEQKALQPQAIPHRSPAPKCI